MYISISGPVYFPTANGATESVITRWTPLAVEFMCSPIIIWGSVGGQRPKTKTKYDGHGQPQNPTSVFMDSAKYNGARWWLQAKNPKEERNNSYLYSKQITGLLVCLFSLSADYQVFGNNARKVATNN